MRSPLTLDALLKTLRNTAAGRKPENQHLFSETVDRQKKQKYNNVIIEFDGYIFRSKRECAHYVILRAKQIAGEIKDLQLQIPFELNPGGTHSLKYVCDFLYIIVETGEHVVDDTKGKLTTLFLKKQKLMKDLYGIIIRKT